MHQCLPEACAVTGMDEASEITIEPAIVNPTYQQFPLVIMDSTKVKKNEVIGKIAMFLEEKSADSITSLNKPTNPDLDVGKFKQQIANRVQK
uniref:AMP-binding enzyme C-terminal domain-containing protein n=1 Tax=Romanomermis culicivorax TaxID=13658 RepID=A0A915KHJ6_ROMCU